MPVVVWCGKCKTAIWAYDEMENIDLRGVMNHLAIPCPECGEIASFDGWCPHGLALDDVIRTFPDAPIYDWWSALRAIFYANVKDGTWAISPDCRWFNRPEEGPNDEYIEDLTDDISDLIKENYKQKEELKALSDFLKKKREEEEDKWNSQ